MALFLLFYFLTCFGATFFPESQTGASALLALHAGTTLRETKPVKPPTSFHQPQKPTS